MISSNNNVIFRGVITNHGNAYNNETGFFIAPLGGIYVFHLYYLMDGNTNLYILIQVNNQVVCSGHAFENYDQGVCSAVVQLDQGDVVSVRRGSDAGNVLFPAHGSGFSGFLLSAS